MACKQRNIASVKDATKKVSKNEKYLNMVFALMKSNNNLAVSDKDTHFNNTEIGLLSEILYAKSQGRRLISTQLAKLLGVTRSAISQIVNRLEANGVVKRVADDVDRKIAYIEITDEAMKTYEADMKIYADFIGRVVKQFGEDKFNEMYGLIEEFIKLARQEKENAQSKVSEK